MTRTLEGDRLQGAPPRRSSGREAALGGRTLDVDRLLAAPGHRPATRDARLTMADGRIAAIDATDGAGRNGRIALPAMVNAHDHGYGVRPLALGGSDDALECWIASLSRVTVDPRLEAAVAFGRMALAGIGATVHCHNSLVADRLVSEAAGVALAAADVGIRVAFSCPIRDRNPWVYGDQRALLPHLPPADRAAIETTLTDGPPAHQLVEQVEAIAAAHENELFQVQYGPIGPQWCRDTTLERIAEASAANDRRVHMHLLESRRQREWLDATYRRGIVRFLDDIGLLSPRLTVAHGVHLTDAECALLAERGVTVAVNTACNLRLRSGVAPVGRFMRHGLRIRLRPRRLRARRRPGLLPRPAPRPAPAQRHRPGTGPAAGPPVRRRLPPRLPVHRRQRRLRRDRSRRPGRPGGARLRGDDRGLPDPGARRGRHRADPRDLPPRARPLRRRGAGWSATASSSGSICRTRSASSWTARGEVAALDVGARRPVIGDGGRVFGPTTRAENHLDGRIGARRTAR